MKSKMKNVKMMAIVLSLACLFAVCTIPATAASTTLWGDANGDGAVNGQDLLLLRKYLANFDYETQTSTIEVEAGADANGDGTVNGQDLLLMRKYLANYDYETGTSTIKLGPDDPEGDSGNIGDDGVIVLPEDTWD